MYKILRNQVHNVITSGAAISSRRGVACSDVVTALRELKRWPRDKNRGGQPCCDVVYNTREYPAAIKLIISNEGIR